MQFCTVRMHTYYPRILMGRLRQLGLDIQTPMKLKNITVELIFSVACAVGDNSSDTAVTISAGRRKSCLH
jgi:hypothetical protein